MNAPLLLVTGASRGLGRHIAERAVADGYRVVGFSRKGAEGADLPFPVHILDVADPEAVAQAFAPYKKNPDLFGLVHAAGIASMNLVLLTPPATIQRMVGVNLLGTIYCCQQMGRFLARRGGGRIITFSTIAVPLSIKGEAIYAASKAGVESFTRTFAREMAEHGVTVNAIAPGPVETDLIAKVPDAQINALVEQQVIPRMATPEDIYASVRLLLSPDAAMISGQVLRVGGV